MSDKPLDSNELTQLDNENKQGGNSITQLEDTLRRAIARWLDTPGNTLRGLAKATDIDVGHLSRWRRHQRRLGADSAGRLSEYLGLQLVAIGSIPVDSGDQGGDSQGQAAIPLQARPLDTGRPGHSSDSPPGTAEQSDPMGDSPITTPHQAQPGTLADELKRLLKR